MALGQASDLAAAARIGQPDWPAGDRLRRRQVGWKMCASATGAGLSGVIVGRALYDGADLSLPRGSGMLAKRIIPCLDINDGRVVKGVHFVNLRDAGDPVEQAGLYDRMGADELVFLDIIRQPGRPQTLLPDMVRRVADQVFMPLDRGRRHPQR